jgi:hypothetical protein
MKNSNNQIMQYQIWKTLVWILFFFFLIGPLLAQEQIITLHFENADLETVLYEIKRQSDNNFIFNHEEVQEEAQITIHAEQMTLEEALDACLKDTHLEYEIRNKTVIIKPKKVEQSNSEIEELKTQTIRGKILDRDSKAPLPFANVVVMNTSPAIGGTSDLDGYFKIEEVPVGRHALQISYVGYEKAILSEILVGSAKEVVLNIELNEASEYLDEFAVTVKKGEPLNEMATISAKSFSVEETKRYPASISDPARMAQVFAGVSISDDASNEIVIRGNSPNGLLWRLEGIEIPSPNHFAEEGYTAGAVSILSTNLLDNSDFYIGAFSAEYGNALSGVFDIKLRSGNYEEAEYSAQVGVLGIEGSAEGPFKKGYKGSYLVNYRYSTFSLLNSLGIEVSENALPNYQDLSFKLNLPTQKAGTFSVWGIGGNSDTDEKFLPDTTLNETLSDGYSDNTRTGMFATGISHTYFPNSQSYIKSVASVSRSFSANDVGDMDSAGIMQEDYRDDLKSGAIRFNSFYNRKVTDRFTLRTGVVLNWMKFDYFAESVNEDGEWQTGIDGKGNTELYQAYFQARYHLSDRLMLTGGVNYSHFALSKDNSLEPRLSLQYTLDNAQRIGLGFGMHSRHETLPTYFVAFENEDGSLNYLHKSLGLTRSTHYLASYEKYFGSDWQVKTEVYFQSLSDMPIPTNANKPSPPSFNGVSDVDTLVNAGTGQNYGIELTVRRFFTKGYYVLFTGSLFQSKFQGVDGRTYNGKFNSNYIFNGVGGKEIALGNNQMLSFNAKILWSGGKRLIPIDLDASIEQGETVVIWEEAYTTKAPDYFRIDIGVKYHLFKAKSEHTIALDIQNVTNRLNVWNQFYDPKTEQITNYYMAGLIPILSYRIEF